MIKYILVLLGNIVFASYAFSQTDKWCYDHNFYYKNYDNDTLVSIDIGNLPFQCTLLSSSIFYDHNILNIQAIGMPISDTLHNMLCRQNMINQWDLHRLKYNNELFQSKNDYVQNRMPEISIFYLGQVRLPNSKYNSYVFLIKDGDYCNDTDFSYFLNRKILLLNCINTRIMSMLIMAWNQSSIEGYGFEYYTCCNKKGYYHYKGRFYDAGHCYASKKEAKRAEKRNTDLGIIFTFDKDGYVKIIKEQPNY
jgi:hypothetical protein